MSAVTAPPCLRDALAGATTRLAAAGVPEPRVDAEVLLAHAIGCERSGVIARGRETLAGPAAARFADALERRAAREPVAYIIGAREFWSLPIVVDRRVLIPRPETELVVETVLRVAPGARRILDVGTGSGAIALALCRERAGALVVGSERAAPALAVAAENRRSLAPGLALVQADLVGAFRAAAFDVVVANPPYCAEGAVVQAEVRDYEPATALYAGPEGLDVLRRLVQEAARVLAPGGWLMLEMGMGQAGAVLDRLGATGCYEDVRSVRDGAGIERVAVARRREAAAAAAAARRS